MHRAHLPCTAHTSHARTLPLLGPRAVCVCVCVWQGLQRGGGQEKSWRRAMWSEGKRLEGSPCSAVISASVKVGKAGLAGCTGSVSAVW
mmetsp:Transcript_38600/g.91090  ORF Transcript_38600/g.91090 Transcript_38600/m.91090 type:complete len:89 (-) Transcript_38600:186-452(-)